MAFEIPASETRTPRSFTLKPTTIDLIEEVARLHKTNASRVVEAICIQFLPKIIEQSEGAKPQ